jgi:hypothetical protein
MSSFQAVTTRPHRAFRALHWRSRDLFVNLALVCLLTGVWIASLRWICRLWIFVFRVGAEAIGQPQALEVSQHVWAPWIHFYIPYLALSTGAPTVTSWTITVFVVLLAWVGTYWLRGPALPLGYLVRAAVIIMCTSLVYFAFGSARFPHDLASYNTSMLSFSLTLTGLLPTFLGLTYFILERSVIKKLLLTGIMSTYFVLFVPVQYLLQSLIIHQSVLVMPLLYFAFGPLLEAIAFVCFYGWAMSWPANE